MKLPAKSRSAQPASPSDARPFIKWFADITIADIPLVGGKNASLGEMVRERSTARLGRRVRAQGARCSLVFHP